MTESFDDRVIRHLVYFFPRPKEAEVLAKTSPGIEGSHEGVERAARHCAAYMIAVFTEVFGGELAEAAYHEAFANITKLYMLGRVVDLIVRAADKLPPGLRPW